MNESGSHNDFRVRHSKLCYELRWLKANKYYTNVDIDEIALQQLPEDGDLTQCYRR